MNSVKKKEVLLTILSLISLNVEYTKFFTNYDSICRPVITLCYGPEPFLTRCIPYLKLKIGKKTTLIIK